LVVFVIDTSDSMGDGPTARISAALGASIALAANSYLNRDQVCLVTFRDREAQIVVPPTNSVTKLRQQLQSLPIGGATPLAAGLKKARQLILQARIKSPAVEPLMVLLSDGEATVALENGGDPTEEVLSIARQMHQEKIRALIIDTNASYNHLSLMPRLAQALGSVYQQIHELRSGEVLQLIEGSGPLPTS
jgi:magnesium chelatase subunit D